MSDKKAIFEILQKEVGQRISTIQAAFDDLNNVLTTNTKSSAGDKHETGRAMAQLEQEKLSKQLNNALELRNTLGKIDLSQPLTPIQFGSLVETSSGTFFISVSLGSIRVDEKDIFCISPVTPMGKALINGTVGQSISFNGQAIKILDIT